MSISERNFQFWIVWLKIVLVLFALFGILLAFFNQTSLFDAMFNQNINPIFFNEVLPEGIILFQQWIYGLLGATCALVGFVLFFIVHYAYTKKEKWAWNVLLGGVFIWFMIDTPISIYFSVTFNVLFNIALFAAILLPLLCTRKFFKK